jgi:drug/metabolite transporter (DMT)-like permease
MNRIQVSGFWWMVLSALSFSVMTASAKVIGTRLPPSEIILVRTMITLGITYTIIRQLGIPVFGRSAFGLLFLRGVFGFAALMSLFYSLPRLPLAEATLLQYLNPLFVAILGVWILRERLTRVAVLSLAAAFAGVVMVTRPGFLFGSLAADLPRTPVLVAVFGALMASLAYISIRKLKGREHPMTIVLYLPLVSLPFAAVLSIPGFVWPTPTEWLLLVSVGVFTQAGQMTLTRGLMAMQASHATTVGTLQVAFAATWGVVLFSEIPSVWTLIGAACIVGGAVVAGRQAKPSG